ncbi:MAG: MFS transporter [Anaerolineales bacterium]|nr:MFS transporter [Anaerolineales bacterium]
MSPDTAVSIRDLLRIRDFRWLWLGQIVSNFGDALTHLTLVLYINRVTDGSTTAIATLLIALALPQATLGLVAGVFVDRWDRKRTMIISDLVRGVLVLAFIYSSTHAADQLWLLYLVAFAHACAGAFFLPARSALVPNVVPAAGLLAANSLGQMSVVFFRVLGTAAAGLLVGLLDVFWPAFVVDAATFFLSALFIARVALATPARARVKTAVSTTARALFAELQNGLGILLRSRVLVGTLVAIGVTMFGLGAVNVLLAPLLVNDMQVPETWFGVLEFVQSGAMILGSTFVAVLAARFRPTSLISGSLLILGIDVALFALVGNVWHFFPILFVAGLVSAPLNAAVATIVQTAVADEVRGRISSALGATIQTTSLLSMFLTGAVAAAVGVRSVFIISGAVILLASVAAAWIFRGYAAPRPALQPAE